MLEEFYFLNLLESFFGINIFPQIMSVLLSLLLFFIVGKGDVTVDGFNRFLMLGLFLCYGLMIGFSFPEITSENLSHVKWKAIFMSFPILVISFGYHNLIPSLARYLDGDLKALKRAIIIGSLIPLAIYLLWEYVILGIVPLSKQVLWQEAKDNGQMISHILEQVGHSKIIVHIAQWVCFFFNSEFIFTSSDEFCRFFSRWLSHASHEKKSLSFNRSSTHSTTFHCTHIPLFISDSTEHCWRHCCKMLLFAFLPALMVFQKEKKHFQKTSCIFSPFLKHGYYFS